MTRVSRRRVVRLYLWGLTDDQALEAERSARLCAGYLGWSVLETVVTVGGKASVARAVWSTPGRRPLVDRREYGQEYAIVPEGWWR